jgi:hypothetical protein
MVNAAAHARVHAASFAVQRGMKILLRISRRNRGFDSRRMTLQHGPAIRHRILTGSRKFQRIASCAPGRARPHQIRRSGQTFHGLPRYRLPQWRDAYPFCHGRTTLREQSMSTKRYFIVQHDADWMIKFADEEFGPYRSQSEAILFAVDAARKLTERGAEAEVCLMGENGHFSAEWSGGQEYHAA